MINDLLNEDCVVWEMVKDRYGKFTKGNPVYTKCRAREEYRKVKNKAAEEVVSSIEFWLSSDVDIDEDNVIEYNENDYTIIATKPKKDMLGNVTRRVVFV
ncbi:hypothetical protein [Bacillus sp. SM2101]|uniref:hypothetical protein n=1 Tax=Bacillus sp. SM2101 TaxID=2805366 RepID=UPI001BDE22FD|nr:hypothetical protein [Bacillus sp. SM2101]